MIFSGDLVKLTTYYDLSIFDQSWDFIASDMELTHKKQPGQLVKFRRSQVAVVLSVTENFDHVEACILISSNQIGWLPLRYLIKC